MCLLFVVSSPLLAAQEEEISKAHLHNLEGYNLLKEENYQEAIACFQKAIEFDPEFATAYNNLGSAYYNLDKYDKAIEQFKKVIELEEDYTKAYFNLASAYFWEREFRKAYSYYRRAEECDKEYVEERKDIEKARTKIETELEKNPDDKRLQRIYNRLSEMD